MIVITAASGRLGRAVAAELEQRGRCKECRVTARSPDKLADLTTRGFEAVRADYDDAASMAAAFADADALLLISGTADNEVRMRQHRAAIDAAKAAGVRRIVYTSFTNPSPSSLYPYAAIHGDTERYLRASGVPYTVLRNNQYAANVDEPCSQSRQSGVLASPGADKKVAYVTHADAAAAAVGALLDATHAGRTYEITGPEALSFYEIAAELAALRGRPIDVVKSPLLERRAYYQSQDLPPSVVEALVGAEAATAAGEYERVSSDAELLAGRPTQSIRDYVKQFA
jgi:NAD(P)H dehydrogenase (quinone)